MVSAPFPVIITLLSLSRLLIVKSLVTRIIDISGNASFSIINLNPSGTNGDVFIQLFIEHNLPDSISISTNDGQYDYNSLVNDSS